jgi:myo-inositol 2-dehydrogenase/D-chiro-inositol 1-dehydrogenase
MSTRLRVGVIGLGGRWRRYRRALERLRKRLAVRAVCDQVARRAEAEARRLGCAAAAGPVDLLERDDVDAALLLGRQWFGLWPLEHACRVGKPVFCAVPLSADEAHADDLRRLVADARLPVLTALAPAVAPAVARLGELLAGPLGAARLVRADAALPAGGRGPALASSALLPLLHVCAGLLGGEPAGVLATEAGAPADGAAGWWGSAVLDFAGGRAAQVTLWRAPPGVEAGWRVEVVAERGAATAELPNRLNWRDAAGWHRLRLRGAGGETALLEQFLAAIREGRAPRPNFEDACRVLSWRRAALQSLSEGRRVPTG